MSTQAPSQPKPASSAAQASEPYQAKHPVRIVTAASTLDDDETCRLLLALHCIPSVLRHLEEAHNAPVTPLSEQQPFRCTRRHASSR